MLVTTHDHMFLPLAGAISQPIACLPGQDCLGDVPQRVLRGGFFREDRTGPMPVRMLVRGSQEDCTGEVPVRIAEADAS